jgi:hypothetical protein
MRATHGKAYAYAHVLMHTLMLISHFLFVLSTDEGDCPSRRQKAQATIIIQL